MLSGFQCPADFGTDPLLAVTCSDGNLDGSICNFKCPSGYIVKGAATTTCQITGRWQPNNLPFCSKIKMIQCFKPFEFTYHRKYMSGKESKTCKFSKKNLHEAL